MGSYVSKLLARYGEEVTQPKTKSSHPEEIGPSTPVDARKTLRIDPRSATVGIPRTPIEVNYTPPNVSKRPVNAIPPYLQKKPYLETDLDNIGYLAPRKGSPNIAFEVLPSPVSCDQLPDIQKFEVPTIDVTDQSPRASTERETGDTPLSELRYKILGIDPRSPAADFDRTPILAPKSMIRLKARSQENLARRDSCFELGLDDQTRLSYCETTTLGNIPEVLALPDIMSNLNTLQEADTTMEHSDQFISCNSSSSSSIETISDSEEEITVISNQIGKIREKTLVSDVKSSFDSSIEKVEESHHFYPSDNVNRVLTIAARTADKQQSSSEVEKKITVWQDSISPEISETPDLEKTTGQQNDVIVLPKEEVMIEFDDVEIIKILKIQSTKKDEATTETKAKKQELTERKNKNGEAEGKVFFQEKIFTPDGKRMNQVSKVRTPLGNRSNNHGKMNTMPMKSPQQLLRGKAISTKIYQENTPPRSVTSKLNGTQWDPDSTILI